MLNGVVYWIVTVVCVGCEVAIESKATFSVVCATANSWAGRYASTTSALERQRDKKPTTLLIFLCNPALWIFFSSVAISKISAIAYK